MRELLLLDKEYPERLRRIGDPPGSLFVRGEVELLSEPQIAVVGSRKMTGYGEEVAGVLVEGLVEAGFVITSGLAYGVDTVAHKVALRQARGKTVAVLGTAVDRCYPREHKEVYEQIVERGVVVSEYGPGSKTKRHHFIARNRVVSGLSLGVLIVEGSEKSGTMITAGFAGEQGRDVFAVPGPVTAKYSRGPNELIQKGAKLVTKVEDILEEISVMV